MRTFERVAIGHRISCSCSDCRATRGFHRQLRTQRVFLTGAICVLAVAHDILWHVASGANALRRWVDACHSAAHRRRIACDASLDTVVSAVRPPVDYATGVVSAPLGDEKG